MCTLFKAGAKGIRSGGCPGCPNCAGICPGGGPIGAGGINPLIGAGGINPLLFVLLLLLALLRVRVRVRVDVRDLLLVSLLDNVLPVGVGCVARSPFMSAGGWFIDRAINIVAVAEGEEDRR